MKAKRKPFCEMKIFKKMLSAEKNPEVFLFKPFSQHLKGRIAMNNLLFLEIS